MTTRIRQRMSLAEAEELARKTVAILEPFCSRIVVAGSIRRRRPEVGDIDIVAIPRGPQQRLLLAERVGRGCTIQQSGPKILRARMPNGVQLDVYFADPEERTLYERIASNWGTLLLCRTGSERHNIEYATLAQERGMHWAPAIGLLDSRRQVVASETEEAMYRALDLEYQEPEEREGLRVGETGGTTTDDTDGH